MTRLPNQEPPPLAQAIAARFGELPQVTAVALAGSRTTAGGDERSDLDFYVYATEEIPVATRAALAAAFTPDPALDNRFWEPGDDWIDTATGVAVDVMYRSPAWIEEQLDRVLVAHEASVGYSTCFWHNVLTSLPLFDPTGWFAALQATADRPYPEPLRRAIVAKNHPILRDTHSSYLQQIESAVLRHDRVSLGHRLTTLLTSYFDVLFAVNRLPHPGEKRLLAIATAQCLTLPTAMAEQIDAALCAVAAPWPDQPIVARIHALLDGLDALLVAEGLLAG